MADVKKTGWMPTRCVTLDRATKFYRYYVNGRLLPEHHGREYDANVIQRQFMRIRAQKSATTVLASGIYHYSFELHLLKRTCELFMEFGCEILRIDEWTEEAHRRLARIHEERYGHLWTRRALEFCWLVLQNKRIRVIRGGRVHKADMSKLQ